MASKGFRFCCSPRWNLFSIDHIKDELAKDQDNAKDSHSGSSFFALSYNLIPVPTPVLAPDPVLVLVLAPTPVFSNKLFK